MQEFSRFSMILAGLVV